MAAAPPVAAKPKRQKRVYEVGSLRRERRKEITRKLFIYAFLIVASLPIFLGYLWLLIGSFTGELVGLIPKRGFTLEYWKFLWESPLQAFPSIWPVFRNTLYLGLGTTVIVVAVAVTAAYAISRLKFRGRSLMLAATLIFHAFPAVTLLIALYWILRTLGLNDSLIGVILVRAGTLVPFAIWVMKGFFDNVPWDIEMSALVDGATRFQAWRKVVLPLVGPGIAAISIFAFLEGWSEYIMVVTFIRDPDAWTLASYINAVIGGYRFTQYGLLAAVSLFYMIPVLLFFLFTQKYLMQMAIGGLKGGR